MKDLPERKAKNDLEPTHRQVTRPHEQSLEGPSFFSFRYSCRQLSMSGGRTWVRSEEHRFEDGRLTSEEFEGFLDAGVYRRAAEQAQQYFWSQTRSILGLMSAFLGRLSPGEDE